LPLPKLPLPTDSTDPPNSPRQRLSGIRPFPIKKRCGDQPLLVTASKSRETAKHRLNSDSITLQRKASSQSEDASQYARAQCGAKEQELIIFYRFIYSDNHIDKKFAKNWTKNWTKYCSQLRLQNGGLPFFLAIGEVPD
jgi:hypothetical protein